MKFALGLELMTIVAVWQYKFMLEAPKRFFSFCVSLLCNKAANVIGSLMSYLGYYIIYKHIFQ